jgi:hypothetical protein
MTAGSVFAQAIPLIVVALIAVLVLRRLLLARSRRPAAPRKPRPKRSHLTVVSRSRMDDELNDLLKRK